MSKPILRLVAMGILLLGTSALLQAQSSVNITGGSFLEADAVFGGNDTLIFQFAAPGITQGAAPYVFNGDIVDPPAGFYSCTFPPGCTLATIIQIGKSIPLQLSAPGALFGYGGSPVYCWNGGGTFTYSSGFTYHVKSGVLTVQGMVTPNMSFTPADQSTCNPNGLPTFVVTGQWRYVAQFGRASGMYYLTQMQIDPLP